MFEPLVILVAEDDPNDWLLLELAFAKVKPEAPVHVVRDGHEAMDYLEGKGLFADRTKFPLPTMLLLDLTMPRMDGFAVLEALLWKPQLRPRFVVVLTASDDPEHIRRARLLGADNYVVKPQDPGELVRLLTALGKYWAEAAPSMAPREAHPLQCAGSPPSGATSRAF